MNDIILFMAGGIWVFVMACFMAFIEYLKDKLKEKNELVPEVFTVTRTVEVKIWKLDLSGDIDNDLLKEHILAYKENNPESFTSNIQAWHTPYRTHFLTGIFDQFLQVVNKKINSIITKFKYKNPEAEKDKIIFNEYLIDWDKDIYLCEGPFDALFLDNSIPLLGKKMSDLLFETLYEKTKGKITIVLDGDAWEDAKRLYFKLSGGKLYGKIKVVKLPVDSDIADMRGVIPEDSYIELER